MKTAFIILVGLALTTPIFSQNASAPSIFIDCQMNCDWTFIKQEIQFVNYMHNRQDADIFVLATRQSTGAGGQEVQLSFFGNNTLVAISDTVRYFTDPNATDAVEREQFVQELKKGLLRFLVQTPMIERISYEVKEDDAQNSAPVVDPWKSWVFNIGGNGWASGESTFSNINLRGRFSASKITEQHKFVLSTYFNNEKSTYNLTEGDEIFTKESYELNLTYVRSIGGHWSAGFKTRTGSTTFGNTDISTTFKPAIEFNVFPYDEASTQRFSFNYAVGLEYYDYTDTTIYNKMSEMRMRHGLEIEFDQTRKWGNVSLNMGIQQYFHDLDLYNAYLNPHVEWQIYKGLSLNFGGYASFVNDRINISKTDISDEDILLKIKQLDTDFTYFTYFGMNYRFGSDFNNIVNPRF